MKKNILIEIICGLLVLLFSYTGFSKLFHHEVFHSQVIIFPVLKYAEPFLSWMLPISELIIAILLLAQKLRLGALYASLLLLIMFTLYLIVMLVTHADLPCSCGGVIEYLSWRAHVVFNVCFIALTVTGISFQKHLNTSPFIKPKMQSS